MFNFVRRWLSDRNIPKGSPGKIFGIGFNKTGTTSLAAALTQLGYNVAPQPPAVRLFAEVVLQQQYQQLFAFCEEYNAFQDHPFSLPKVFRALDHHFPRSKFILTLRENSNIWFDSLLRFLTKEYGQRYDLPPTLDVMRTQPLGTDFIWYKVHCFIYEAEKYGLWNREHYQSIYERHNRDVRHYFRKRKTDFLEINIGAPDAYARLCTFLGHQIVQKQMPHRNKRS